MENSSDKSTTSPILANEVNGEKVESRHVRADHSEARESLLNTPDDILYPWGKALKRIEELEVIVKTQNALLSDISSRLPKRVWWEDQVTESGIQLGATKVRRTGTILGSFGIPVSQQQLALMFIVCRDGDNNTIIINGQDIKYL